MDCFNDILKARRQEISNLIWVFRKLETVVSNQQNARPKPETHKKEVLTSDRMRDIIQQFSIKTGKSEETLTSLVRLILDEIGFNKQLKIIRWLGLILSKITQKIYTGIYVNENSIKQVKSVMGKCPVIFAPSHRSYADFILMSYVCFTYDIEIPAIAAGMDFHAMWGMGSILRDTGAFFMRRSFNDDVLYWETFKQYVHQIVTRGDLPIEFFIEGTRSRSCKSLIPKLGLLSMILKPLFTGEVPDILIVPISINYERVLEEKLFAFELLGIPKPKESTTGLFKSLSVIKENFGSIYIDFSTPISVKQYFSEKLCRVDHAIGPLIHQQLTSKERILVSDVGYEILRIQRQHAILILFNLTAVLLSTDIYNLSSLTNDLIWLRKILEKLGAKVVDGSFDNILKVHDKLIKINSDSKVEVIQNFVDLSNIDTKRLKGYKISNETMTKILPNIMLQLYVNPTLHYFANYSLITIGIFVFGNVKQINKGALLDSFQFLRSIFSYEFAFYNKKDNMVFEESLENLCNLNVIEIINNDITFGSNEKLQILLINLLNPFVNAYCSLCHCLKTLSVVPSVEHTAILKETQKQLELDFKDGANIHPYSLNLDSLSICLQSLTNLRVLEKLKESGKTKYKINNEAFHNILSKLDLIKLKCYKNFRMDEMQSVTSFSAKL